VIDITSSTHTALVHNLVTMSTSNSARITNITGVTVNDVMASVKCETTKSETSGKARYCVLFNI